MQYTNIETSNVGEIEKNICRSVTNWSTSGLIFRGQLSFWRGWEGNCASGVKVNDQVKNKYVITMATEQLLKYSRKPVLKINIYIFRDASYDPEENCI
jgi:hypothetical protein